MADRPRHEAVKASIAALPAKAKLLKKAYDQHQQHQQKHREELKSSEDRVAELEKKLSEATDSAQKEHERHEGIIRRLQERLSDAATDRDIYINPEDSLGNQLNRFIQLSPATSSLSKREADITAEHERMKNRCQDVIKRSCIKNDFTVYDVGDVETNLSSYIEDVGLVCRAVKSMMHAIESDSHVGVKLSPQSDPQVAMQKYIATVRERSRGLEEVTELEYILKEASKNADFSPLLTWTLTKKLRGYCEFVQDALKAKDKMCKALKKDLRLKEETHAVMNQETRHMLERFKRVCNEMKARDWSVSV